MTQEAASTARNKRYAARRRELIQSKKTNLEEYLRYRLTQKRATANHQGVSFSLDEAWLDAQPRYCAVTSKIFVIPPTGAGPMTPHFDRKDPKKGYTPENTQLVCAWYNNAKNEWPEDEIRALIVAAAKQFQKGKKPHV